VEAHPLALPFPQVLAKRQPAEAHHQEPHCRFAPWHGGKVLPMQQMLRQGVEAHLTALPFQQMLARRFAPRQGGKALPKQQMLRLGVAHPRTAVL